MAADTEHEDQGLSHVPVDHILLEVVEVVRLLASVRCVLAAADGRVDDVGVKVKEFVLA